MKKLLLAGIAAAAFCGAPALAADLPTRPYAPAPAPAPVFTWTGFYAGANIGYGWGEDTWSNLVAPDGNIAGTFAQYNTHDVLGGFQWGYNRQVGQWVFGFASDFDFTAIKGSGICFGSGGEFSATCGGKAEWISTSTVLAGWAIGQVLPYVKGGWAMARDQFTATNLSNGSSNYLTTTAWRSGWTLGGGIEFAFDRNWSAFMEYDYLNFGNYQEGFTPSVSTMVTTNFSGNIKPTISVVKGGVNFRYSDWLNTFLGGKG